MSAVEGGLESADDLALHGEGAAGDPGASGGGVTATTEFGGDFIDVNFLAFRAEANAGEVGLNFLKNASHDDRSNGSDMIDQTFRIAAIGTGACEVGLLEPEISNLIVMREPEMAVNVTQEPGARKGI